MDYSNIAFVLELYDDLAEKRANDYLSKGWLLISVGPKLVQIIDDSDQAYYNTSYVVGATKEQYQQYLFEKEQEEIY